MSGSTKRQCNRALGNQVRVHDNIRVKEGATCWSFIMAIMASSRRFFSSPTRSSCSPRASAPSTCRAHVESTRRGQQDVDNQTWTTRRVYRTGKSMFRSKQPMADLAVPYSVTDELHTLHTLAKITASLS
jgi:hypothetical protein